MATARAGLRATLDFLLPPHCPGCDELVGDDGELCPDCFVRARFVLEPSCHGCAAPFETEGFAGATRLCERCEAAPPAWDRACAAFVYDEFSRRLVLPLKYADRTENARVLGIHMARAGASILEEADLLIPVPLHRSRLRSRRYNQAALLGRAVLRGRNSPVLMVDALVRTRRTAPLALQGARARALELAGAIGVRASRAARLRGARVVLVDDVLTTGSTAATCAQALKEGGAASVALLVAARTAGPTHGGRADGHTPASMRG